MNSTAGRTPDGNPADEIDLVRRFVRGDAAAFDQIVTLYSPRIAALAYRLSAWTGDVDDIVQDVFLAALDHRARFRGDSSLWTWLTAITVNCCRARWRRRRLWRLLGRQRNEQSPAADQRAIDGETSTQVRAAVADLPRALREVIVLYYLQEMPTAEICQALRLSRPAVEVRLHRGREKLRITLSRLVEQAKK